MIKKTGPNKIGIFVVLIFFVIYFIGPLISSFGSSFGNSVGNPVGVMFFFGMIVPIIIFIIIVVGIINFAKNLPNTMEEFSKSIDQKIEIPLEFFKQGPPAMGDFGKSDSDINKDALFKDVYGRKILYYENGKPVYEKHEH